MVRSDLTLGRKLIIAEEMPKSESEPKRVDRAKSAEKMPKFSGAKALATITVKSIPPKAIKTLPIIVMAVSLDVPERRRCLSFVNTN